MDSSRRDFTHADDIVRGVIAALDKTPAGHRSFNLGSGSPITLADLVTAMEPLERKRRSNRRRCPFGDVDATFADITRARDELGWTPQVPLEAGLRTVVDYLRA